MDTPKTLAITLLCSDEGQDLIEYGLLAAIVALSGVLVFPLIQSRMGGLFTNWGQNVHNVWTPNNPITP